MAIPNIATLYQKIARGSEGGLEFARIVKILLQAEYNTLGVNFISESDASGDYRKLDGYIPGLRDFADVITGFQYKFYPAKLSSNQRSEIIKSLDAAIKENPFIKKYILVTPEDWNKSEQKWFDDLRSNYEKSFSVDRNGTIMICNFELVHWGHSRIVEMCLKHEHVGNRCFPELFSHGVGKFKLAEAKIDCKNSDWLPFKETKFQYYQSVPSSKGNITTDPVFDFQFINNSKEIFLLQRIEIHLEKVWAQLKGIPVDHLLLSVGTIQHKIDFRKRINVIEFNDPMVFGPGSAKRLNVQLLEFTKRCPGNCVELKFWFHFNDYSLPSELFYLSF